MNAVEVEMYRCPLCGLRYESYGEAETCCLPIPEYEPSYHCGVCGTDYGMYEDDAEFCCSDDEYEEEEEEEEEGDEC